MAILHIEHLGIAVKSLIDSTPVYEKLLNTTCYKTEEVLTEKVKTSFLKIDKNKFELLEGTDSESPISKFIEKRGEGIHHVALAVDNIIEEMNRLKSEGFVLLNEVPKVGADNKLVCFIHPKSANGVLIELCQEIN